MNVLKAREAESGAAINLFELRVNGLGIQKHGVSKIFTKNNR